MKRSIFAALGLFALAKNAHATSGTALAETSRPAALANAISARSGDAGTMLQNPAGLADVRAPQLLFTGNFARLEQSFARVGEPAEDRGRTLGGFGLAAATPLFGPLRRIRLGFALDTPAEHALRVAVPTRLDEPRSPIYDGRPDRISALFAAAIEITRRLKVGAGVQITPSLDTPTEVSYVAGRDKSVDKNVVIRLDRDLKLDVSPLVGVRVSPFRYTSFAVVYRSAAISRAKGSQRTIAGGILADDPIDFFQMWDPNELVFGTAFGPWRGWSVSFDVTVHQWSQMKTGFDTAPDPALSTTVSVRSGLEWTPRKVRWLTLRTGWAVDPSPIREQVGVTNYLGSSVITVAGGGGVDLRRTSKIPVSIDLHVRALIGHTQSAHKEISRLPDASGDLPGKQVDNFGYPAFYASATAVQLGLTATIHLGKETHR